MQKTEQNKTKQTLNKTKQKQNKTKQEQKRTKQNKNSYFFLQYWYRNEIRKGEQNLSSCSGNIYLHQFHLCSH